MLKRIYIAGKVTGELHEECVAKFDKTEKHINNVHKDVFVINPMKIVPKDTFWKLAMKICLRALIACDAIYILEDWHLSRGATIEVLLAKFLGIEMLNIKPNNLQIWDSIGKILIGKFY